VNAIQVAFVAGLLLVLLAVVAFSITVVRSAARGGRVGLFGSRSEHAELGRAAFLAHRLTGFAIFAFLALHILDIGLDSVSHRLYDEVQKLYGTAPLRVFECGLLLAVLFHTGNGLRLLVLDGWRLSPVWSRRLLVVVLGVGALAGAGGSALILAPLFG
jgi:succinate dehydrogenase cytochrome b subunit